MKKRYKAVLFDYDGTLVDTNQLIVDSWDHMYQKHFGGHLTGEDVKWTFGMVLWDAIDDYMKQLGHSGYDLTELVESYREFQLQPDATPAPPFEGMVEAVHKLKEEGVLLGIVTSRGYDSCIKGLKKYGMDDCFDAFVTAESTDIHKPLPEPALIGCRELGVDPADAVMVGDSIFDLICGNDAGCDTCFVTWSFATGVDAAIKDGRPTYVVNSPQEMVDLLTAVV